ncbi:Chromophore lyase CpcT/CpeT [Tsuneonella dongtanensis]|uniref:Chromophore lyase CpcT/CpeT n=1 Tax=Tsuneonella dongtanensis TaxID=692370 RepID=A0A1B2AG63_9SPHN|nr:chromophore lyase CpcT/CpeT [Tsuneonella dongtanensis]ANY21132.1 Chromophore lyase CpcT/CpeT [Tsuneonella dongtanensis]
MSLLLLAAAMATPDPALDYAQAAVGVFSSEEQHRADPRYDWAEARVVRIWPDRTDGVWLYQQQAIINQEGRTPDEARARPYFQFVARVRANEPGVLRRDNYRVRDGAKWLNIEEAADAAGLSPADLAPPSCHNRLEKVAIGTYTGRTESCENGYKGAARMQSLSITTVDAYINWDRGFDPAGGLVWGPASGGYVFKRIAEGSAR